MAFEEVLKSIFPVPDDISKLKPEYEVKGGHGHTTYSLQWWDNVSETPTNATWRETYQFVKCEEHGAKEAVPTNNYYDGWLNLWYDAGLHPRWNIWGEMKARWPVTRFPSRWEAHRLAKQFLAQYPDDPEGFVKAAYDSWYNNSQIVTMRANGVSWRVTRTQRDKFRDATYTVKEFLKTNNQTERQLMLMSRSFAVKDILQGMTLVEADDEGELYVMGNMTYLHVNDSSTDDDYLLAVPRKVCQHGEGANATADWVWHDRERCRDLTYLTPAMARRWHMNVPLDAEILLET